MLYLHIFFIKNICIFLILIQLKSQKPLNIRILISIQDCQNSPLRLLVLLKHVSHHLVYWIIETK